MPVRVRVPTPLRKFTQGVDEVSAQGANVKALVEDLEKNFPGIRNGSAMKPERSAVSSTFTSTAMTSVFCRTWKLR